MECTIADVYYNTHLDTEVTAWGDAKPRTDPCHVFKTLYRTRDGDWYLRNRSGEREDIVPVTVERARELLEQRNVSALVRWFGERVKKALPPSAAALRFG